MKVDPCPEMCKFDWKDFHAKLDIATAHLIEETDKYPSNMTLMEFLEYSNKKKIAQEGKKDTE